MGNFDWLLGIKEERERYKEINKKSKKPFQQPERLLIYGGNIIFHLIRYHVLNAREVFIVLSAVFCYPGKTLT